MEIRVNDVTPIQPTEAVEQNQKVDDGFRFTLASAIDDAQLAQKMENLLKNITTQGNRLAEHMDIHDMKQYRKLVKEYMNECVSRSHSFSRENFLDRHGRHRVYGIVRLVDEKLDELAKALVEDEKDHLDILDRVDEIRGLLLDIST